MSDKTKVTAPANSDTPLEFSQRLISPLDWTNTRRTFDGARLMTRAGGILVDGFGTRPVVVDTEAGHVAKFEAVASEVVRHKRGGLARVARVVGDDLDVLAMRLLDQRRRGARIDGVEHDHFGPLGDRRIELLLLERRVGIGVLVDHRAGRAELCHLRLEAREIALLVAGGRLVGHQECHRGVLRALRELRAQHLFRDAEITRQHATIGLGQSLGHAALYELLHVSGVAPDQPGQAGIILPPFADQPLEHGARIGFGHDFP